MVVVVTPCLLDNPWAAWALHHALKASLQARTRALALMLQVLNISLLLSVSLVARRLITFLLFVSYESERVKISQICIEVQEADRYDNMPWWMSQSGQLSGKIR